MVYIYHNPRCRKSREALALLGEKSIEPEVIEYLKDTPDKEQLKEVIEKLGVAPEKLIRKNEADYNENFKGKSLSDEEWIEAMVQYPKLIERPIVIHGEKAVVARSAEELLKVI